MMFDAVSTLSHFVGLCTSPFLGIPTGPVALRTSSEGASKFDLLPAAGRFAALLRLERSFCTCVQFCSLSTYALWIHVSAEDVAEQKQHRSGRLQQIGMTFSLHMIGINTTVSCRCGCLSLRFLVTFRVEELNLLEGIKCYLIFVNSFFRVEEHFHCLFVYETVLYIYLTL